MLDFASPWWEFVWVGENPCWLLASVRTDDYKDWKLSHNSPCLVIVAGNIGRAGQASRVFLSQNWW